MLANNLKALRKLKGWSQAKTASNLEIGASKYQSYEEERAEPNITLLIKISDLYEITVDQLIREDLATPIETEIDMKEIEKLKKKYPEQFKKKK